MIIRGKSFPEYLAIPAANHSVLSLFSRSAAHAYEEMTHPTASTKAQDAGQSIHAVILEPGRLESDYAIAPKCDRRTREGKATWAAFESCLEGREIITAQAWEAARGVRDAVYAHPVASALLSAPGHAEVVAQWVDERTGVSCKGRIDKLLSWSGWSIVLDLKTTRNAQPWRFAADAARYHYHSQAAFYVDGLNAIAPLQRRHLVLAVESEPPYACMVYEFTPSALEQGRNDYEGWLRQYAESHRTGVWPPYPSEIAPLQLPKWAMTPEDWVIE